MQKEKKAVKPAKTEAKKLSAQKSKLKTNIKYEKTVKKKEAKIRKTSSNKPSAESAKIKKAVSTTAKDAPLMFKGKKKKYYDLLMRMRDQILGEVKFLSEEAIESKSSELAGSISNHMADFGSDNFLHDMELHMLSDDGEILEMIDEALERLQTGEYGKCLECSCQIPEERLEVKPYARYCIKCKTLHENNGDITP